MVSSTPLKGLRDGKTIIKDGEVQTLCRMCDMRCSLNVHIKEGEIIKVTGFEAHPQARGRTCAKGRAAVEYIYHPDRLLTPLKKQPDGTFSEISYDQAMDEIAGKIDDIKKRYGARAMGVWTGEGIGFFQQEEYARRFIHALGSPNYFSAESVCYASRYIAYYLVQGYWEACPDFENADLILSWGANPGITHMPYMKPIDNALKKGAKLIVIDPRFTQIARKADRFIQLRPGTDGALAWGLAQYLIERGAYDREFVKRYAVGFDKFAAYARRFTPEFVEQETGVNRETIVELAQMIIEKRPRVVNYLGISLEHQINGFNISRVLACLSGLCGAIDIEGGEPWTEGMDRRELTLYDEIPLLDQRPIGADKYPVIYRMRQQCHSMTAMDYMLGNGDYPLRGLIVSGSNPVLTNPNAKKVTKAFQSLDLLVFRELFLTESAKLAHYILPAASFLERSELHYHKHLQSVTLTNRVLDVPGVQDEYTFWHDLAHRFGFGEQYFPWKDEEEVNRWILELSGITLEELKSHPEGIQYKPRRYKKYEMQQFPTTTGKYEFSSQYLKELGYPEIPEYVAPPYLHHPDKEYPLVLITGARKPFFVHSRYRNIKRFKKAVPKAEVEIHPADATRFEIRDKERIRVVSEIGFIEIEAKVVKEREILPGVLQITHGWNDANVNLLTDDHQTDPISGYPNMKIVPVRIEKVKS